MDAATIDVADPVLWDDPHGALARARALGPVARTADGQPVLLRFADVDEALRHPGLATFSVQTLLDANGVAGGPLREWCDLLMLSLEGDDHARLRGLVSRAFTPRRVEAVRGRTRRFVRQLLDERGGDGELDWVHDVAHELPVWVVCEMLGVPSEDRHRFKEWTVDLALVFANVLRPADRDAAERGLTSLLDYVRALVAERRRPAAGSDGAGDAGGQAPAQAGGDLLTALVQAEHEGHRLSPAELEAMVVNLLQGGHETTRSALSIGLATLLAHPTELVRLHDDPGLVHHAVEELLRFESPTFSTMRVARRPVRIGGVELAPGDPVHLSLLAANRDPEQFADPDRLDVGRLDVRHVSFGFGVHHCIGAALARLELQEALGELVTSCRTVELRIEAPVWVPFLQVRRIESLPIAFRRVGR
jgi:cytochrome P450